MKSIFFKNITQLITGTVLAQLIPILIQPFLRRAFDVEMFGLFAVYMSVVGILVVISTLRYEQAIVLPDNDKIAANIIVLSIIINALCNLFFFFCILLFRDFLCTYLNISYSYVTYLYLIPVSAFLFSNYQIFNTWLIRKKAFTLSSSNKVVKRASESTVQYIGGTINLNSGLIGGEILGGLISNIVSFVSVLKTGFSFSVINKKTIQYSIARYKNFPLYNLLPSLLNVISLSLPVVVINKYYSNDIVGYFDLSRIILSVPAAFVAVAVSNVLLQSLTEKKNKKESVFKEFYNLFYILLVLSSIEIVAILLFGNELFALYAGEQYEVSGIYSKVLIFSFAIKFVISPLSIVFIAFEKLKSGAVWQILYFFLSCSLFLFKEIPILDFLLIYTCIDVFAYLIYFVMIANVIRKYEIKNKGNV